MLRRDFLLTGATAVSAVLAKADGEFKLTVHVTYTGSGTVDESHKVYVVLWNTPDFVKPGASNVMPIEIKAVSSKSADTAFDVQQNPVYVSVAYDPTGKWDAQSEPPVGTSLGLYAKEPGVPAPVPTEPGKTAKISITFGDSFKKS